MDEALKNSFCGGATVLVLVLVAVAVAVAVRIGSIRRIVETAR